MIINKKQYQLRLLEKDLQTAVIRIKSFRSNPGTRFYRKAFRFLAEHQIPRLVIDLRNNGGGSGKDAMNLVSYINDQTEVLYGKKKRGKPVADKYLSGPFTRHVLVPVFLPLFFKVYKDSLYQHLNIQKKVKTKNNFDGQVFLLLNGLSFSSSAIAGAYLLKEGPVITIGQESGGGQAGTNAFQMPSLRLPHSKVELIYPFYEVHTDIDAPDRGRGIIPDHPVVYTLEDVLEGKDLEIEKVIELLKE